MRTYASLEAVKSALGSLPEEWKQIDVLINNAGLARGCRKSTKVQSTIGKMIDTNIKGLLYVSRIVLPWMVARRCGTVINIARLPDAKYTRTEMSIALRTRS
jgi:NADP-dependent 3-hydroxy acid dehydrogenase YdfG